MKTTKTPTIGIIGGMGPQASALLQTKIINTFTSKLGAIDCKDFPRIINISVPVEDFISDTTKLKSAAIMVGEAAKTIASLKPDQVVIACNTAHLLVDLSKELRSMPLVELPQSVVEQAKKGSCKKLGILASPTSIKMGLFEKTATNTGIQIVNPNASEQRQLEQIIRNTIAGINLNEDAKKLRDLCSKMLSKGCDMVALACTELSVVGANFDDPKIIDSLNAACEALLVKISGKGGGL